MMDTDTADTVRARGRIITARQRDQILPRLAAIMREFGITPGTLGKLAIVASLENRNVG